MNYISTWLYIEDKKDKSYYPQVGGTTANKNIQDIYWKCIFSFFHSSLKFNKNTRHLFFTNKDIEDIKKIQIDNIHLYDFFYENNIDIVKIELSNKTPEDWFGAWRNQFYLFDILNYIKLNFSEEDSFLILDSDCVFTKNIDDLFEETVKYGNLCLKLDYEDDYNINGISQNQMTEIYNEIFKRNDNNLRYYGGELFAANYKSIYNITNEFNNLWELNFKRYNNKQLKLNEEAHFLSCLYKKLNIENQYANKFIKRMWTSFRYNNIDVEDENLAIWHLPAEKRTGFVYLFDVLSHDYKKYLDEDNDNYKIILKKVFGIPKKSIKKQIKDLANGINRKINT